MTAKAFQRQPGQQDEETQTALQKSRLRAAFVFDADLRRIAAQTGGNG
jgi:hypothetical protein